MPTTCHVCGGDFKPATVRFCYTQEPAPMVVERVPAEVCDQCGERLFDSETVGMLERLRDGAIAPVGAVTWPVYDFATIPRG